MQKFTGIFHFARNGNGYVTVNDNGNEKNIFVVATYQTGVFDGDTVVVATGDSAPQNGEATVGRLISVEKRASDYVIGEYRISGGKAYVMPDSYVPFRIPAAATPKTISPRHGDKIVAQLNKFRSVSALRATPVYNLGAADTLGANLKALIYGTGHFGRFSVAAEKQAQNVKPVEAGNFINKRVDLRGKTVFALNDFARPSGMAFSISKTEDEYLLGVHIADVAEYAEIGSPLDEDAKQRGKSINCASEPMNIFPNQFINSVCRIFGDKETLTLTAFVTFDGDGNATNIEFCESVISPAIFASANDVDALISGADSSALMPLRQKYSAIVESIELMYELAAVLRSKRLSNGSVDFDVTDRMFIFNSEKRPTCVSLKIRSDASLMISELLTATGAAAGEKLYYNGVGCIYSGVSEPKYDSLTGVPDNKYFLPEQDYLIEGYTKREANAVRGTSLEKYCFAGITELCENATLSFAPIEHFVFRTDKDVRFFTPAERYSDLLNMRAIKAYINERNFDIKKYKSALENEEKISAVLPEISKLYAVAYLASGNRGYDGIVMKKNAGCDRILLECGITASMPFTEEESETEIGKTVKVTVESADMIQGRVSVGIMA